MAEEEMKQHDTIYEHIPDNTWLNFSVGKYLYPITVGIIFLFACVTDYYIVLARILTVVTLLMALNRVGKGVILRELIALHGLFVCVFMPTFGYTVYNQNNALAKMWLRYMPIPEEQYFSFALPAMALFVAALCWPIYSSKTSDQGIAVNTILDKAKQKLLDIPNAGFYLMAIGGIMFFISRFMPDFLQFLVTLIFWSSFAGVLYIYYSRKYKYKAIILSGFVVFLIVNALQSGMFTILVYMGITLFSLFFIGKKVTLWKKLLVFCSAILFVFMIQSVKASYRVATWKQGYEGNKAVLFGTLLAQKWNSTSTFFDETSLFPIYYRTNQGINVALVMRRFPKIKPHDNGTNLFTSFVSALVPRLLWPDKPEAGGKFNMLYYTGLNIKGCTTNVGPLGEAYGSFGVVGGIVFMFVLGIFIRWAYSRVFAIASKLPLLLFWIPVLFYQVTYSAESDTLQILNSLFKSAFFVWLIYKMFPRLFGAETQQIKRTTTVSSKDSYSGDNVIPMQ